MADVVEADKAVTDIIQEQENIEVTANGEKNSEAVNDEVKTNSENNEKDVNNKVTERTTEESNGAINQASSDAANGEKDNAVMGEDASAPKSPDLQRKDDPVSLTAHERHGRKRTRGGHRYNANINSRFDDQPVSTDPDEIRRQVEFYFSDSNLPIDAYLLSQTGGHSNRPVPLKVIHNFKRMKHFQPFSVVRDAVEQSTFLDLNDEDEITRKTPLADRFTDDPNQNRPLLNAGSMPRSIYAKGFGDETETTHLDIEELFEPYGPINSIRLRRTEDGGFKGSVFVEFKNIDAHRAFLELESKPEWKGTPLEIMSKQEYVDHKHQGIMDGDVKPRSPTRQSFGGGRGNWRGKGNRDHDDRRDRGVGRDDRGSRDHDDPDNWRARRDRDQQGDRRDRRDDRGGRGRGGQECYRCHQIGHISRDCTEGGSGGDRSGGGNGGRGRGRGNRGGRGGRRPSPDANETRKRRRSDEGDEGDEIDKLKDAPSRAEAEAKRAKVTEDAVEKQADSEAAAGAEKGDNTDGGVPVEEVEKPAGASKKRALEEEGDVQGEAKKVKEVES